MRLILLADTHGALDPRIAGLAADCEYAVHAGDIGCMDVLRALVPRKGVVAIRGNNDVPGKWPPEESHFLRELPDEASLQLPGGTLMVVHGHRAGSAGSRHQRLRARYAAARAIVYGHSHRMVCDLLREPWVLNPGAAGRARTFGGPSCLILFAGERQWSVEPRRFASPETRRPRGKR